MRTNHSNCSAVVDKRVGKANPYISSQRRWTYFVFVLGIALIGITVLPASAHAQANESDSVLASNGIQIDARVTGYARQVLASVMRTLAPEDRENVIYVDLDNRVYANKPELLKDLYLAPMATDNSYISPTGNIVAVPQLTSRPVLLGGVTPSGINVVSPFVVTPSPNSGNTGPFRRVYSKATTTTSGYSWESARITLRDYTNVYTDPAGSDTAEVYEGGWCSGCWLSI